MAPLVRNTHAKLAWFFPEYVCRPTSPRFVSPRLDSAAGLHRAGNKKDPGADFLRGDKELGFLLGLVELDIELGVTASGPSLPGNVSFLLFTKGWGQHLTS